MSWGSLWSGLFGKGNMESNAAQSMSGETPSFGEYPSYLQTSGDLLTYLNQQNDNPGSAAEMLKLMAQEDKSYAELYAQLKAERENQERAYQWYEDFNNSYYQRSTKDLEAAGLNPWLALQSLGSGGSGSVSPAGTWSGTSGSTKAAKMAEANKDLSRQGLASAGSILAAIAGAIILALL